MIWNYFVSNDCGDLRKSTKKEYIYWLKTFVATGMDKNGRTYPLKIMKLSEVENGYNGFGVLVCEKREVK